jgi:hypothetical protein
MVTAHDDKTGTDVAVISDELAVKFARMATLIPAEDGAGYERIVGALLNAKTLDDLNAPWEASKAERLVGTVLRLDAATRRPSDFKQGLGVFLVLHCTDTRTGEKVTVTTGAVSVVAQVVNLYATNKIPAYIEFVVAERPTEAGYRPHHLRVHAVSPAAGDD